MVKLSKVQIGTPTLIKLHFIITRTKIYKKNGAEDADTRNREKKW
jgi:hypothetical protein